MSEAELMALLPLMTLGAAVVVAVFAAGFLRRKAVTAGVALAGPVFTALSVGVTGGLGTQPVTDLLIVDDFARVYLVMILGAAALVVLLAHGFLDHKRQPPDEFFVLVLLGTLGAAVLSVSNHFASFFLGLETLTVSLYALIGYERTSPRSIEAAIKYLLLAGATSATLLFGLALVYAAAESMTFSDFRAVLVAGTPAARLVLLPGLALMLVGIGFKLALAPFHMWTPDVYQGSPVPTTAFVATVSKGAVVAALVRLFSGTASAQGQSGLSAIFGLLAVASMVIGKILALRQDHLKRILAYSSIAHLGYALVAFVAGGDFGAEAVTCYLMAYFVGILTAFGAVSALSFPRGEADHLSAFRGLVWRRPAVALALSGSLLSLAGIPLTAGVVGKVYVAAAGVRAAHWILVLLLALSSAVGLFYYLRVIATLFDTEQVPSGTWRRGIPVFSSLSLCLLGILLLWLGIDPAPFQGWAVLAAAAL